MKRLILLRHAKSGWNDPGMRDFDRPLSERGERDAPAIGARLRERGIFPDRIVSSPAVRAARTAELIADAMNYQRERIVWKGEIYEASAGDLLRCIRSMDEADERILLIGHNPGISDVARRLTGTGFGDLPTCAAVGIDLNVPAWAEAGDTVGKITFHEHPARLPALRVSADTFAGDHPIGKGSERTHDP
ncbi:MAG TPA: histidine phosphatase family protein [bacterium]|nr:histidine phosphatase family protein [bacterium]